jgi:hypothetical protein
MAGWEELFTLINACVIYAGQRNISCPYLYRRKIKTLRRPATPSCNIFRKVLYAIHTLD